AAIALQRPAAEAARAPAEARRDLARSYQGLGKVLKERNQFREAEEAYRHALSLRERLAEEAPDRPDDQRQLAAVRYSRGGPLAEADGAPPGVRQELARSYSNLGVCLEETGADLGSRDAAAAGEAYGQARGAFNDARQLLIALVKTYPLAPAYQNELAAVYAN